MATDLIRKVEEAHHKKDVPSFRVGDTIRVSLRVKEGDKTRTQIFEGTCIRKHGKSLRETCTLLKESHGDKVEKTFPVHSPLVEKIVRVKEGNSRRAKLYYLRKSG